MSGTDKFYHNTILPDVPITAQVLTWTEFTFKYEHLRVCRLYIQVSTMYMYLQFTLGAFVHYIL